MLPDLLSNDDSTAGQATDQPRYPGTNASLGTNPNPPTSDNGVTSTKLTREEPCRCMSSWAYVSPMHDGHCCFHPANQKCHPDAFAVWERELHRLRFERTSVPSMNGGSRVVSSASPSTGDQQ